jgi:cytochrome c556
MTQVPWETEFGMRKILIALGMVGTALIAGTAIIATAATPAQTISLRKGNFKEIGGSFKTINDEIKSGSPNLAVVRPAARDIAARARATVNLFPRGTGAESGVTTRALPAIWANASQFVQAQRNFIAAADALNAAATSGNAANLSAAAKALGATCKSCHEQFRETD